MKTNKLIIALLTILITDNLTASELHPFPGIQKCINGKAEEIFLECPFTREEKVASVIRIGSTALSGISTATFLLNRDIESFSSLETAGHFTISLALSAGAAWLTGKVATQATENPLIVNVAKKERSIAKYYTSEDSNFGLLQLLSEYLIITKSGELIIDPAKIETALSTIQEDNEFKAYRQKSHTSISNPIKLKKIRQALEYKQNYIDNELNELQIRFALDEKNFQEIRILRQEIAYDLKIMKAIYDFIEKNQVFIDK